MKNLFMTLAVMSLCSATAAAQTAKTANRAKAAKAAKAALADKAAETKEAVPSFTEWHDLQVNAINRFPLHSNFFAYENRDAALKGDMKGSGNYLSLNGVWKFKWVKNPPISLTPRSTTRHGARWRCLPCGS